MYWLSWIMCYGVLYPCVARPGGQAHTVSYVLCVGLFVLAVRDHVLWCLVCMCCQAWRTGTHGELRSVCRTVCTGCPGSCVMVSYIHVLPIAGGQGHTLSCVLYRTVWTDSPASCFGCLTCICFVFLDFHLFSAVEHVSHEKAL